MGANMEQDQEQKYPLRLMLDDLTLARLLEVAIGCQDDPSRVAANMLRDILEDDARAHDGDLAPVTIQ